jgi:hypothetical protein
LQALPIKPRKKRWFFLLLIFLFLFFAGVIALTRENGEDDNSETELTLDEDLENIFGDEEPEEESPPVWIPRWFRSNSGGMTLEEIPSRLAALRNQYALVIDYLSPDEIDPFLNSFYSDGYTVEIRILFEHREEIRRQWLFRDEAGVTRLNAVFRHAEEPVEDEDAEIEAEKNESEIADNVGGEVVLIEEPPDEGATEPAELPVPALREPARNAIVGFIEVFNENSRIIEDYLFTDDDKEILTVYSYNENLLIKAVTQRKDPYGESKYIPMYTDNYRYNRSYSLRNVVRLYHEPSGMEPVRILFPGRVLDAAYDDNFISDKLSESSDFMGSFTVDEGYRMVYDTDSRGRILSQTMLDEEGETVWVIKNTWQGERIAAVLKIEGEEELLTEYDYDGNGDRIEQREIRNGVLERLVRGDGDRETEELYMNGVVVLRAYYKNGKKISEERVRNR